MNMKKLINIIDKKTLMESDIKECEGMSEPKQLSSVSMTISLNAQGVNGIRNMMNLIHGADPSMVTTPVEPATPMKQDDVSDVKRLAGLDSEEPASDSSDVTAISEPDEEQEESYANSPDEEYQDQDYMVNDLSGGLGKKQKMFKHSYRSGDNPETMEESIRLDLQNLYKQYTNEDYRRNSR